MLSKDVVSYIAKNAVIYDADELLFSVSVSMDHKLFSELDEMYKSVDTHSYKIQNVYASITDFKVRVNELILIFSVINQIGKDIGFTNFKMKKLVTEQFILVNK